jgi:hypothetical protein
MSVLEKRLAFTCQQVGDTAAEFMEWIADNGHLLGAERVSLLHELYAAETAAERLALSASQPPCVAFVGPRRSGKTSAIIPLVNGGATSLSLRFDGVKERVDYVAQIMPDSKAGLSMAVRLSHTRKATAKNFPIAIRLLSTADVVKILGSAFLSNAAARGDIPTLQDVKALQESAAKAPPVDQTRFTQEDVWEIRAYFAERFGADPVFRALSAANYWQMLAKYGPMVNNEARGQLLRLLWGGLTPFTAAFVTLANIVDGLGGNLTVNCALNAVLSLDPRTGRLSQARDSVINASTADGLGRDSEDFVMVCTEHGVWNTVPRAGLTALAAEVRLTLQGNPTGVPEKADVLEFPGIDAGAGNDAVLRSLERSPAALGQVFMKAKAAYLLDRYIIDHKITAMVVCIDPATREIGELASLVQRWVERTHGADASAREQQDSALFLAFTKFDKALAAAGREHHGWDWDERIRSILLNGFGRQYAWPHEWIDGRPFDSIFLLRSPGVKIKHLLDYGNDGSETGYKPQHRDRIQDAASAFLGNDVVHRYVADPRGIWREAMLLNDGGITYLGQSIAEACDGRVKQRQLILALNSLRQSMRQRLQRYFLSDSFTFQQDRRHTSGLHVVRRLRNCTEQRRLGHLLRALQVSDSELADVLQDLEVKSREAGETTASVNATVTAFAHAAVDHWVMVVRALASNAAACHTFKLPRQALLDLVDELVIGAIRQKLDHRIAETTARLTADCNDRRECIAKAALVASRMITDYVMSLGLDGALSNNIPRRKGRDGQPIFTTREAVGLAALGAAATATRPGDFHADWAMAFLNLIDENVAALRERDISDDQNRKLGRLIRLLGSAQI